MNPDEQAVRAVHETWIEAVNRGDLAHLLTLVTDDLVLLNPDGPPLGREGFAAKFSGACQELKFYCTSELDEVIVNGDLACTRCHDALTVTPRAGGATMRLAGHRMSVYRRQPDGRWLLARDIHNLTPVKG